MVSGLIFIILSFMQNLAVVEASTDTSESDSDSESESDGDSSSSMEQPPLIGDVMESNVRLPNSRVTQQKKPTIEVLQDSENGEKGGLNTSSDLNGHDDTCVHVDKKVKVQACYIPPPIKMWHLEMSHYMWKSVKFIPAKLHVWSRCFPVMFWQKSNVSFLYRLILN